MPAKKKTHTQQPVSHSMPNGHMHGRTCTSCKVWGVIGGALSIILGAVLYMEVISLETVVGVALVLGGVIGILGSLMRHYH